MWRVPEACLLRLIDTHFPLVHSFIAGEVDEALARQITAANAEMIERAREANRGFYFFINALHIHAVTPTARKLLAEWDAALTDEQEASMRCRVVLADSLVVRGAISAMRWFSPRMRKVVTAKNFDGGLQILDEQLALHDESLTPEEIAFLRQADSDGEAEYKRLYG